MGGERQGQVSQAPWEATGGLRAEGRRVPPYPLLWGHVRCSFTEEEMEAQGHIPGEWCSWNLPIGPAPLTPVHTAGTPAHVTPRYLRKPFACSRGHDAHLDLNSPHTQDSTVCHQGTRESFHANGSCK